MTNSLEISQILNEGDRIALHNMTQQPISHIDATPDDQYPLRILKAYRNNCDCKWTTSEPDNLDTLLNMMNQWQDQRGKFLDWAIRVLEEAY